MTRLITLLCVALFLNSCNNQTTNHDSATTTNHANDNVIVAITTGNDSVRMGAYWQLIDSLKMGKYTDADLTPAKSSIFKDTKTLLHGAVALQKTGADKRWIWDDMDYGMIRENLGVMLDILGNVKGDTVIGILKKAELLEDNRMKLFAVISLLKNNETIESSVLDTIAADDETRIWLFKNLEEIGKKNLFPNRFKTQPLLAKSDLVNWLTYPTELGRVPDEIKIEDAKRQATDGGPVDIYLFKFRSDKEPWAKTGWMAGIAGGFMVNEEPTANATGYTFSNFEKWESKTPNQHFMEVLSHINEANKNQVNGVYKEKK